MNTVDSDIIAAKIYGEIRSKVYSEKQKLPTLETLAGQYNTSVTTIRNAIAKLRADGVVYTIRGSGVYVSNTVKPVNKSDLDTIAVIIYFARRSSSQIGLLNGITTYLNNKGYKVTLYNNTYTGTGTRSRETEQVFLEQLYQNPPAGILYYPVILHETMDCLIKLQLAGIPLVLLDKEASGLNIPSIESDNVNGGFLATMHLIEKGHRKIAFIASSGIYEASTERDRFAGYCKAMMQNNLELNTSHIFTESNHGILLKSDKNKTNRLTEIIGRLHKDGVTGIFCINDDLAIQVINIMKSKKMTVPEDFSIVGFDNLEISEHLDPPLSTIAQDFNEMGELAAQTVISLIKNKHASAGRQFVPVNLIERGSVKSI